MAARVKGKVVQTATLAKQTAILFLEGAKTH
jgi:hypothetical protein